MLKSRPLDNPWKIETVSNIKILHYLVSRNPPFTPILENRTTPVILDDGEVISIGRQYLAELELKLHRILVQQVNLMTRRVLIKFKQ